ncbi:hypothetical protein PTSG_09853 [Salpingoeca rosetta]|uniref:IRS-type PTB domain-containing protein n=1 Tax=Salpingoeca rosetta (strain ATCC 50818 / BSB-021) TaxID=946362 RepID=F2UNC1_SALR5|nr:uncharacterized protein PTSG_09853 [Salpingoeca rosetta]EGD79126.1 hypothetical protein PTSG_09853 [Salpingoeca rosetta]|eukprot:XP_004989211.1 hypothetical protein PTSG_09853 [Salpingoeca rosetta]
MATTMKSGRGMVGTDGSGKEGASRSSAQLLMENEQLYRTLARERGERVRTSTSSDDHVHRQVERLQQECRSLRIQLDEEKEENRILQNERDRLQREKNALASGRDGQSVDAGSDQDSQYYSEEIERLRSECKQTQLRLKECQLNLESSELVLEGYRKEVHALTVEREALENLVEMLRREQGDPSSSSSAHVRGGVDMDTHQRALEELMALEKDAVQAQKQHQAAQEEIRFMAEQMTREQGQRAREMEDMHMQLHDSKSAYDALLSRYASLERAYQALQVQLEEAYRMQRNAQAQAIYATTNATTNATTTGAARREDTLRSAAPPSASSSVPGYSASLRRIRVDALENWGDGYHAMPTGGPKNAYYFPVNVQESMLSQEHALLGPAWLRIAPTSVALLAQQSWDLIMECPLSCVRKFGKDEGVLSFELGRHAPTGQGVLYLATIHMTDIFDVLGRLTGSR